FQMSATFNMYDLLGITPVPGTRWRLDTDYLSSRGPGLGSNYEYLTHSIFDIPASVIGSAKVYGMYDGGKAILGGRRGENEHHPDLRGRFFWWHNVYDLPAGFTVQTQISALSDKHFHEQYYRPHF